MCSYQGVQNLLIAALPVRASFHVRLVMEQDRRMGVCRRCSVVVVVDVVFFVKIKRSTIVITNKFMALAQSRLQLRLPTQRPQSSS
jgi:hypothetical protein